MNILMNPHTYWLAAPLLALLVFSPLAHDHAAQLSRRCGRRPLRAAFIRPTRKSSRR